MANIALPVADTPFRWLCNLGNLSYERLPRSSECSAIQQPQLDGNNGTLDDYICNWVDYLVEDEGEDGSY